MKILYSWLKDYVDITEPPAKLADELSMFAHEVETIQKVGQDDAILDLEITPNRGDCLSHLGIARQIGAMEERKIKDEKLKIKIIESEIEKEINIKISDPKICPRYSARIIENVKVEESPSWLKERLLSYGFKPINNIVDITNYVMIAIGQPLHAFDLNKISDGVVNICLSKKGDEVMTLDGKNRELEDETIIIRDSDKIYDLTGIMGGYKSEIDVNTTAILLQGALFDPVLIRRASKRLHLLTDASYRYERGVDPLGTIDAVNMAAEMIQKLCPACRVGKLIDKVQIPYLEQTIKFEDEKINHLLGINLTHEQIVSSLEKLYFKVTDNVAIVPSFRIYDVTLWQDLAEEVARIYGYENIEIKKPTTEKNKINNEWVKRERVKDALKNIGFTEIYSYSFADKEKIKLLGYDINNCAEILNPISPETQYLRPSLLPSLLLAISKNPWSPDVNIFEIEKVFDLQNEKWQLGIATVGKSDVLMQEALKNLGVSAEVQNISQNILDVYKIRRPVKIVILEPDSIAVDNTEIDYNISENRYRPISKFAPTIRDLSFIVPASVNAEDVEKSILEASGAILFSECFDEYTSSKIGENLKNIAFHVWMQNTEGVLSGDEADKIISNILNVVENKFQAKLRS
jgi:phenylalanyl-tRNA synthetase beta chain